jgi:hypothetical protein
MIHAMWRTSDTKKSRDTRKKKILPESPLKEDRQWSRDNCHLAAAEV